MVCMNYSTAVPALKPWGKWLPGKVHASGHVLPRNASNLPGRPGPLLADMISLAQTAGGCPGILWGPLGPPGVADRWARGPEAAWCL